MSEKKDTNHLKQEKDLLEYIEIFASKKLSESDKEYLRGVLNLTFGDGYKHGCEINERSSRERDPRIDETSSFLYKSE